jgi:GT2 family glycosyltransferase
MRTVPVTLCVPTYSRYDLCDQLLHSAASGDAVPDAFVVLDNGGAFRPSLEVRARLNGSLRLVRPGRNLGVAASWNWFMLNVPGWLLICNDDVRLDASTLTTLLSASAAHADELLLYPMGRGGKANILSVFLTDRRLADAVGYFDEAFHPAYFEDDDYLYRMKLRGLRPMPVTGCGYFHHCSATLKSMSPVEAWAHEENFTALRRYYVAKWGGEPGAERFTVAFGEGT